MGVENYPIADSMIGVIAQRLVRKLCPHCRKAYMASEEEKRILRASKMYLCRQAAISVIRSVSLVVLLFLRLWK